MFHSLNADKGVDGEKSSRSVKAEDEENAVVGEDYIRLDRVMHQEPDIREALVYQFQVQGNFAENKEGHNVAYLGFSRRTRDYSQIPVQERAQTRRYGKLEKEQKRLEVNHFWFNIPAKVLEKMSRVWRMVSAV